MVNLSESIEFKVLGSNKEKKQIIITETKRDYKKYINSLKYRYNKKNPYLPNYVLTKTGETYQIMKPENYSNFMNNEQIDKKSIIIALENYGWLKRKALDNTYVNWIGDIYKEEVFEKNWRNEIFWDKYGIKQIEGLSKLLIELCKNFKIPFSCVENNVKQDGIEKFNGIVSKSNFDFIHKDVNPSFDFKLLKNKLQNDK